MMDCILDWGISMMLWVGFFTFVIPLMVSKYQRGEATENEIQEYRAILKKWKSLCGMDRLYSNNDNTLESAHFNIPALNPCPEGKSLPY